MSRAVQKRRRGLRWPRAIAFCALFACVFLAAQYVLLKKYEPADCWPQRFADYADEPAGSVDMVFLGSSQSYWGTSPIILWNEAGIASVNMSGIMHHHTIVYEQLKALLEMNTPPKYVVFNPSSLLSTYKAGEEKLQPVYEQFIYTLPTLGQKVSAFRAMLEEGEGTVDVASFLFPLLRYHSRWQELTAEDFLLPSWWAEQYRPWLKGQMPMMESINITEFVEGEVVNPGPVELVPESVEGWLKIFALCRENGITPIALILPRFDGFFTGAPVQALTDFLDENGVAYINYMDEVTLAEMSWDYRRHFKDREHLSFVGSIYASYDLAWRLSEVADWEDHRGDPAYEQWDLDRDRFFETYRAEIEEALGADYYEYTMME